MFWYGWKIALTDAPCDLSWFSIFVCTSVGSELKASEGEGAEGGENTNVSVFPSGDETPPTRSKRTPYCAMIVLPVGENPDPRIVTVSPLFTILGDTLATDGAEGETEFCGTPGASSEPEGTGDNSLGAVVVERGRIGCAGEGSNNTVEPPGSTNWPRGEPVKAFPLIAGAGC